MKYILIITFLVLSTSCYSQRFEWQYDKMKERDGYVIKMADSLNSMNVEYGKCTNVPVFFTDSDFDRTIGNKYWLSSHASISLRKLIIDKIDNRALLDCVLKSNNKELHIKLEIPDRTNLYQGSIPYQHFSTYDLVSLRIEELENVKRMGDYNRKN